LPSRDEKRKKGGRELAGKGGKDGDLAHKDGSCVFQKEKGEKNAAREIRKKGKKKNRKLFNSMPVH